MELTAGQLSALDNLLGKQAGREVDWINIADARALTELGLAERSREGWRITPAGEQALAAGQHPRPVIHVVRNGPRPSADDPSPDAQARPIPPGDPE